jgi:hypothetical protein
MPQETHLSVRDIGSTIGKVFNCFKKLEEALSHNKKIYQRTFVYYVQKNFNGKYDTSSLSKKLNGLSEIESTDIIYLIHYILFKIEEFSIDSLKSVLEEIEKEECFKEFIKEDPKNPNSFEKIYKKYIVYKKRELKKNLNHDLDKKEQLNIINNLNPGQKKDTIIVLVYFVYILKRGSAKRETTTEAIINGQLRFMNDLNEVYFKQIDENIINGSEFNKVTLDKIDENINEAWEDFNSRLDHNLNELNSLRTEIDTFVTNVNKTISAENAKLVFDITNEIGQTNTQIEKLKKRANYIFTAFKNKLDSAKENTEELIYKKTTEITNNTDKNSGKIIDEVKDKSQSLFDDIEELIKNKHGSENVYYTFLSFFYVFNIIIIVLLLILVLR